MLDSAAAGPDTGGMVNTLLWIWLGGIIAVNGLLSLAALIAMVRSKSPA